MIILNADDWGRSVQDTEAAASLVCDGRITSLSAMVFMQDSERAAALAKGMDVDVGLHLNFCELLDAPGVPRKTADLQKLIAASLDGSRYSHLVYRPHLQGAFKSVYLAQMEEFRRLYGTLPSHVDGHRHLHLCANMLVGAFIRKGLAVRRSFSFASNERGLVNRTYRRLVDARLSRRHLVTDYFFSLEACLNGRGRPWVQVADLARRASVEVMTHPRNPLEYDFLASHECIGMLAGVQRGTYVQLGPQVDLKNA